MAFRYTYVLLEFWQKNHGDPYYEPTIVVHDFLPVNYYHSHFLATNLDFTTFFCILWIELYIAWILEVAPSTYLQGNCFLRWIISNNCIVDLSDLTEMYTQITRACDINVMYHVD